MFFVPYSIERKSSDSSSWPADCRLHWISITFRTVFIHKHFHCSNLSTHSHLQPLIHAYNNPNPLLIIYRLFAAKSFSITIEKTSEHYYVPQFKPVSICTCATLHAHIDFHFKNMLWFACQHIKCSKSRWLLTDYIGQTQSKPGFENLTWGMGSQGKLFLNSSYSVLFWIDLFPVCQRPHICGSTPLVRLLRSFIFNLSVPLQKTSRMPVIA